MSELKPCPFCGKKTVEIEQTGRMELTLRCNNGCINYKQKCGRLTIERLREIMTKDWNTRPREDALQARIAELDQIENERGELMLRILGTRNLEALLVQFQEQKKRIAELTIPADVLEMLIFSMNYIVHYCWIGKEYQKALDWLQVRKQC